LAFYLPQFHPIAENDAWWGPGFTEWTNVVRARSAFAGHYQPHLPADLGFYDLRCSQTRHEQARLARAHGIHGFCYYHYWFNGRLLLETPMLELLEDADLDFPFCVCWANENWTRRWDGRDEEMLIAQDYSSYDPDAHIAWLARAFRDNRYVRVNERPLFLVYRASDLPDVAATLAAWRRSAIRQGLGDLYLCGLANSQNALTPAALIALGFDAVVEFEPNLRDIPITHTVPDAPGLNIYRYRTVAERAMARSIGAEKVFPCVFPSWDNTARRGWRATSIQNEDAVLYRSWLEVACSRAMRYQQSERLVFINAWNEWAEGCHLEPDARHGSLFLRATAGALGLDLASDPASTITPPLEATPGSASPALEVHLDLDRPIYIWGSGSAGQRAAANFRDAGVRFRGFLDNDARAWGAEVAGHPIHAPEAVLGDIATNEAPPFIVIGSIAQDAIRRDIERAGGRTLTHYLPDAADLSIQMVPLPAPGFVRLGTWPRPVCPVCLFTSLTRARPVFAGVCQRCHSSEPARLTTLVFCDMFVWAQPPIVDCATRRDARVVHRGAPADYVPALDALVTYERVLDVAGAPRDAVDLIIVSVDDCGDPRGWLAHAAGHLAPGGQLVFVSRPERCEWNFDVRYWAARHGLAVGLIDRDWPRYGVGRAVLWVCRKDWT
jgi:hypothetical protein